MEFLNLLAVCSHLDLWDLKGFSRWLGPPLGVFRKNPRLVSHVLYLRTVRCLSTTQASYTRSVVTWSRLLLWLIAWNCADIFLLRNEVFCNTAL